MAEATFRVAVLASGGGTNLQALLDACVGSAPARVVLVISNKRDAGALARARAAGVDTAVITKPEDGVALLDVLAWARPDLVVLAGYLRLVPEAVVAAYAGRMINIHPALLPAFGGNGMYGRKVHQAVIASGAAQSGASVHLVTTEYDRGAVIAQWPVPVIGGDTAESLAERVLGVEHQLLPQVVLAAAKAGRVVRMVPPGAGFALGSLTVELQPVE